MPDDRRTLTAQGRRAIEAGERCPREPLADQCGRDPLPWDSADFAAVGVAALILLFAIALAAAWWFGLPLPLCLDAGCE